ncbi:MAG: hypothetical protein JJT78_02935 [Leptospira sp.]|nr:hypothetical protein [Leptospira sp.]
MQAKVIHAYKKWEELQRDVLELTKLKDRISEDRDYSGFLKDSFQREIEKLSGYREDLLKLKVGSNSSTISHSNQEDGKKLYQEKEQNYREEVAQERPQNTSINQQNKKETKKKTERPVYKY